MLKLEDVFRLTDVGRCSIREANRDYRAYTAPHLCTFLPQDETPSSSGCPSLKMTKAQLAATVVQGSSSPEEVGLSYACEQGTMRAQSKAYLYRIATSSSSGACNDHLKHTVL